MPAFVAAIGGMLLNVAGSLVFRVLVGLGMSVVTYTGVDTVLEKLKTTTVEAFQGMPVELVAQLSYMKVGVAISIIFSAVAVRLALSSMASGVKRFRLK